MPLLAPLAALALVVALVVRARSATSQRSSSGASPGALVYGGMTLHFAISPQERLLFRQAFGAAAPGRDVARIDRAMNHDRVENHDLAPDALGAGPMSTTCFSLAQGLVLLSPTLNERGFIRDCLESLVHQQGCEIDEILVLDGGLTDGTREHRRRGGSAGAARAQPRVNFAAAALPIGVAEARNDLVVRADAHTQVRARLRRLFALAPPRALGR